MTIQFRSASVTHGIYGGGIAYAVVSKPAGTVDGDFLVAFCAGTTLPVPQASSTPNWTLRTWTRRTDGVTNDTGTNQAWLAVFTHTAASDPSQYVFVYPVSTINMEIIVCCYQNSAHTLDLVQPNSYNNHASRYPSTGGVTRFADEMMIRCGAFFGTQWTPPGPSSVGLVQSGYSLVNTVHDGPLFKPGVLSGLLTVQQAPMPNPSLHPNPWWTLNSTANYGLSITLSLPSGDTAPTVLNVAPRDTWKQDLTQPVTFAWHVSDPDAGDKVSSYAFKRSTDQGSTWSWWNGSTWQGTEVYIPSNDNWIDFPAGKWANGTPTGYYWSVSVKDSSNIASSYSTPTTIYGATCGLTVTIRQPVLWTASRSPVGRIAFSGTGFNGTVGILQVRVFDDDVVNGPNFHPDLSPFLYRSEFTDSALTSGLPYTNFPIPLSLVTGTYWIYVLAQAQDFSTPGWIGQSFQVSIPDPPAPTLAVTSVAPGSAGPKVTATSTCLCNLLPASWASPTVSYVGWTNLNNATISFTTTSSMQGNASITATAIANGNLTAATLTQNRGIPIDAGSSYIVSTYVKGGAFAANRNVQVGIQWYDINGAPAGSHNGAQASIGNGAFVQIQDTAVAPAAAAYATVIVTAFSLVAGEYIFIDQTLLAASIAGPGWTVGGRVYGNILPYDAATFEAPLTFTSWTNPDGNLTLYRNNSARNGNFCLRGFAEFGQNATVPPIGPGEALSPQVAIVPTQVYSGSAYVKGGDSSNITLTLHWYSDQGVEIGSVSNTPVPCTVSYVAQFVTGSAPLGASFAALGVEIDCEDSFGKTYDIDDCTITQGKTGLSGDGNSPLYAVQSIQRELRGGTWVDLRGASEVGLNLLGSDGTYSPTLIVDDYEMKVAVPQIYRALIMLNDETHPISSVQRTIAPATDGNYWLKCPENHDLNMPVLVIDDGTSGSGVDDTSNVSQGIFHALNRPDMVVISDTWQTANQLSFTLFLSDADYLSFQDLFRSTKVLYLHDDAGVLDWFISISQRVRHNYNRFNLQSFVDITATEVGRPTP